MRKYAGVKVKKTWIAGALIVLASLTLLVAKWRNWFSDEPTYQGKTVTQWLDSMALFDQQRNADTTGQRSLRFPNSPEVVTNDPALRALLRIGSNAVPVLVKRLAEPPRWSGPTARLQAWAEWKWNQLRNPRSTIPRPTPAYRSNFQKARNMASALALLALGTNANAGFPRLIEAWAISPPDAANNLDLSPFTTTLAVAIPSLPERRAEMITGIMAALQHTNAFIRARAATLTRRFPERVSWWKGTLLKMAGDPDASVRQNVLWVMANEDRGDPDVLRLLEATLKEKTNPAQLRGIAAAGLGLAGAKATNSLPLLRDVSNDPDVYLQQEARGGIRDIEKAAADDRARTSE